MIGFDFPLLTKELTEQAMRPRTYIVRFVYTSLLFGIGLFLLLNTSGAVESGREIFFAIVSFQHIAMLALIPAVLAGSLAAEKEKESLCLLLLTTMSPWSILWQKLFSRLIPILTFLTLSFPLLSAAYCYGGIQNEDLLRAIVCLPLAALQLGAITLMASAFCRTTVEAFIWTYVIIGLGTIFPDPLALLSVSERRASTQIVLDPNLQLSMTLVFALASVVIALILARICLVKRAFVPQSNILLQIFRQIDAFYNEINVVTGGVILVKDGGQFPDMQPIAWRETAKKSLGTFRYLFRVLVMLEVPIIFATQGSAIGMSNSNSTMIYLAYLVWLIAVPMLALHAASVVSSERSQQTMDLLLISPLSGDTILREKLAGVGRARNVLMIPLITTFIFQHWYRTYGTDLSYMLMSLAEMAVFFWFVVWIGMWFGLKTRSQLRAVLLTMSVVVALCVGPDLLLFVSRNFLGTPRGFFGEGYVQLLSPARLVSLVENADQRELENLGFTPKLSPWFEVQQWQHRHVLYLFGTVILSLYFWVAFRVRRDCLNDADKFLGRPTKTTASPDDPDDPDDEGDEGDLEGKLQS